MKLVDHGSFKYTSKQPTMETITPPHPPRAFHVMLKPRGSICNLDCAYCFYLQKEALYPHANFHMSDAVLENFTRQYIEAQRVPEVTFAWQGGEPTLMGLDFFRRAVSLQQQYRRPGMKVLNSFQTNGTLLTEEWCRFFAENHFLVGISLDGPEHLHNVYRRDKGGQPTFAKVIEAIELLKRHQVNLNLLACVHAQTAQDPLGVYRFLRDDLQLQFIQFIPIVEVDSASAAAPPVTPRSVTGAAFGKFLCAIFDEWVKRDVGRVFVQHFDVALAAWAGERAGLCVHDETCGLALAMEHNGDIYSCDHYVSPDHFLGNIADQPLGALAAAAQQRRFGQAKKKALPRACLRCPVRFACQGGCPKDRVLTTPEGDPGLNVLCDGYKAFFHHIDRPMQKMAEFLRAGQAPANIMNFPAAQKKRRH